MEKGVQVARSGEGFFTGPGEMRARCREFHWSTTPLGPIEDWPTSLRALVATMLASRHPMFLWWGPELVQIYNDAYRPSLGEGERHPRALGMRGAEFWTEIWHVIGPQIAQVMAGGEATWHEDQLIPIQRNERLEDVWWTYSFGPAFDDSGAIAGVLVVCEETTARVLSEQQQRAFAQEVESQRTRLFHAFQQAPAFLAIVRGPPFVFEFANEAYYKVVGHRELVGRPVFEAIPEAQGQGFEELLERVVATGQPFTGREMPLSVSRTPGEGAEERIVDLVYFPMTDAAGTTSGVLVHGVDVTDHVRVRREVERLLAESERARTDAEASRRRILALQGLTGALATSRTVEELADVITAHAGAVLGASATIIARLAADGEHLELVGGPQVPGEVRDAWTRFPVNAPIPLAHVYETGEPLFLESREEWMGRYPHLGPLLDATGHQANVVLPLIANDRVLGVMGAAFDSAQHFTSEDRAVALAVARQGAQALERAQLFEAERTARAAAESANRAKADFLAAMSHELRTPLNAIAGYAQLLEMEVHGPVTDAQRNALARIKRSEAHLLSLVNDVLNFAKLEAGKIEYDLTDMSLAEAISSVMIMVEPQFSAKMIEYVIDVPPDVFVYADRDKVQQILLNLFSNAIKFTAQGGHVAIECPGRQGTSADTVLLRVTDTGIGIPRQKQDAVFEPFVQIQRSLTSTGEGTGLGMAISRDLARGMGGDLRVRSREGWGAAFTLELQRTG